MLPARTSRRRACSLHDPSSTIRMLVLHTAPCYVLPTGAWFQRNDAVTEGTTNAIAGNGASALLPAGHGGP